MRLRRSSLVVPLILAATACQGTPPPTVSESTTAPVEVAATPPVSSEAPVPPAAATTNFAGTVKLETGPLADADVALIVLGTPGVKAAGKTDADGRYSLAVPPEAVPTGGLVVVSATRDGRTAAALAVAGSPIAVNMTAGTSLAMVILRDRLEAVGQVSYLNGLAIASVVRPVFEAYARFVESLEVAFLKVSSGDQARSWRGIQPDGHGSIDRALADALLSGEPPLGQVFVTTADELKAAIVAGVSLGARRPDAALLGSVTFGPFGTSTIRFGGSSGGSSGGPAPVVPLDTTEGATVIDGAAN